jgi:hypothetical protein
MVGAPFTGVKVFSTTLAGTAKRWETPSPGGSGRTVPEIVDGW